MPKEFVKLISKEGFEFIVDYRAACISNTIKNMLSFDGAVALSSQLLHSNQPYMLCYNVGGDTLLSVLQVRLLRLNKER